MNAPHDPSTFASRGALAGRNGAQLFFCFAGSALLNVVSPSFFARVTPQGKDAWLAATLLAGTVASAAGVSLARRYGFSRAPRAAGLALVAASAAMLVAALVLDDPLAFALDSVALRAAMQYGTQELDRRAVALAGAAGRRGNDLVGLAMRFGGMLVGPLWFGLVRAVGPATLAVVCALALLGAWNAWAVAPAPPPPAASTEGAAASALTPADRPLLAAARAIYASFYLLASSMIFVLADVHHVASPVRRGGVLVTATYGSAVLATAIEMTRRAARRTPREMLAAPALMALVGLALRAPVAASPLGGVLGSVALGVAFARFMLAFRDHATWEAVHHGRAGLLGEYNNLANTSALVGYAVMAALAAACHALGVSYASAAGYGVAALGAVAVPLTLAGDRLRREAEAHA